MTANTNTVKNRIYPGLNCSSVEFFNDKGDVKAFAKGKMLDFEDLPYSYHQTLKAELKKEPQTNKILNQWFPDSELQQLEKFVSCRFGGLDFVPDIQNYQLQKGEYWDCPLRGKCKGEGIVCRNLTYEGKELTANDIKLLKLLGTNYTNEVLAEEMDMCQGTFNLFKKQLYAKLGNIQTKQEAVIIAVKLNLI
ncbi:MULTISPECIES: hypothetical protein [Flavobacteriaceae]|uniref:hypothetical protein n=1 Tax=Flavobacteriaceae TaxID=49546 RepID=UPI003A92AF48